MLFVISKNIIQQSRFIYRCFTQNKPHFGHPQNDGRCEHSTADFWRVCPPEIFVRSNRTRSYVKTFENYNPN